VRTAFVGCVWLWTSHRMRWWRRRPRSYTSVRSKVSGSPPFQTRFGNWEEVNVAPFRDGDKKRPSSQKPDIERIFPKSDQRENKLSNFGCIIVCFHLKESTRKYAGHVGSQAFNIVHKPIIDYSRFPSVHNERWDEDTSISFELARLLQIPADIKLLDYWKDYCIKLQLTYHPQSDRRRPTFRGRGPQASLNI